MMKSFIISSILLSFVLIACAGVPIAPHPTPVVTDTAMCVDAQTHLEQLCQADSSKNAYCCKVVAPTKKGKSFTQFCIEKQNQGVFLNPRCVSKVNSCGEIDRCTQSE